MLLYPADYVGSTVRRLASSSWVILNTTTTSLTCIGYNHWHKWIAAKPGLRIILGHRCCSLMPSKLSLAIMPEFLATSKLGGCTHGLRRQPLLEWLGVRQAGLARNCTLGSQLKWPGVDRTEPLYSGPEIDNVRHSYLPPSHPEPIKNCTDTLRVD